MNKHNERLLKKPSMGTIVSACDGGITINKIDDRAKLYDSCDSSSICAETYYFGGLFLWIVGQCMFRV